MTHSAIMTIDQRYRWSFTAWVLAAACALILAASAKTLVMKLPSDIPTVKTIEHNYGHTGTQIH